MRKLIFAFAMALMVMAAACPKQSDSVVEPAVEAPPQPPEQMVVDPETGENVTGEYLQESLEAYLAERDAIFDEARSRIAKGEDPGVVLNELMERLVDLQEGFDFSIKHIPRIGSVDVPELLDQDRKTLEEIIHSDSEY